MRKKKRLSEDYIITQDNCQSLSWLKASYHFHTYAYRDPRSAFATATGVPVVSPTTALLGIVSTLYSSGMDVEAKSFFEAIQYCRVVIDAPDAVIFFRAFHQLKRYETDAVKVKKEQYKPNNRIGFTKINQGTREYGLVQGVATLYIAVPKTFLEPARLALTNLQHLGTHDSLCALVGEVEATAEPSDLIVYCPPEEWQIKIPEESTAISLSRFKKQRLTRQLKHWYLAGGSDTEIVPFFIKGRFKGTTKGKIYLKHG
jgi:hypothetical protein